MAETDLVEQTRLIYRRATANGSEDVELPFRVLVLANLTGDERADYFESQMPVSLSRRTLDAVMATLSPTLSMALPDRLAGGDAPLLVTLSFTKLDDFSPDAIVEKVPELGQVLRLRQILLAQSAAEDGAHFAESGLDDSLMSLWPRLLPDIPLQGLSGATLGAAICEIDERLNSQMDEILHCDEFHALERAWRSILFLCERMPASANCTLDVLNVSQRGLRESFEDSTDVLRSPLYALVYSEEFGQFGGKPYSCMLLDYEFSAAATDVRLLQNVAQVAAIAHCPVITAPAPALFDVERFSDFPRLRDLAANFSQPKFAKWNAFRETEDARYIVMAMPRFMLRALYAAGDGQTRRFDYSERATRTTKALWGRAGFALVSRLVRSFELTRWCINIVGEESGRVSGVVMQEGRSTASSDKKIPTEILISQPREIDLIDKGFTVLAVHKGADFAAFYSCYSVQKLKTFGESQAARLDALNYRLAAQLPYLLLSCRLSHYIKMMQREHIGRWKNRADIERELNDWIRGYVADMENPTATVRARRPLRNAQIKVDTVDGDAGWYTVKLAVVPHLKYMGSSFTLKEMGRLEKQ